MKSTAQDNHEDDSKKSFLQRVNHAKHRDARDPGAAVSRPKYSMKLKKGKTGNSSRMPELYQRPVTDGAKHKGDDTKNKDGKRVSSAQHSDHPHDQQNHRTGILHGHQSQKHHHTVLTEEMIPSLVDRKGMPYKMDLKSLSDLASILKPQQISAFWNVFMLFDHYETCTINSTELTRTLCHLGIQVRVDDIEEMINQYDDNQNGELDFEEYLNLMTNPDCFSKIISHAEDEHGKEEKGKDKEERKVERPQNFHTPNKPDYRDCIMYEVMNEFFNSNALTAEQEEEIVGFYAKTMKTIHHHKHHTPHAAHVVHHYADGARSLGLTEKEIEHQINAIKKQRRCEKNQQKKHSPYAKPMAMIPPIPKNDKYKKKYKVMSSNNRKEASAIWRDKPIVNYKVKLPSITVKEEKCAENLKLIRKKTGKVKNNYRVKLSEVQADNTNKIWDSLRVKKIPNQRLQDMVEEVFSAYRVGLLFLEAHNF